MSKLISADTALKELLCGKKVERCYKSEWEDLTVDDPIDVFLTSESFRLKPRTITINGIEVPSVKYVAHSGGNCVKISCECPEDAAAIGAALRSIFKPQ